MKLTLNKLLSNYRGVQVDMGLPTTICQNFHWLLELLPNFMISTHIHLLQGIILSIKCLSINHNILYRQSQLKSTAASSSQCLSVLHMAFKLLKSNANHHPS